MLPIRDDHPLKLLFTGLVEHAFQAELGICDPALSDYVADLLIEFVHVDQPLIAKGTEGQPVSELAEILRQLEAGADEPQRVRDRRVHQRIGDFTLFWAGVFPEGVRRSPGPAWRDRISEYVVCGKRSYAIASELTQPAEDPPADLLKRLSDDFEFCVHGLGIVRRELGEQQTAGDGDLIY